MDEILSVCDEHFLTPYVYPAQWTEDNLLRQFISLNLITNLGAVVFYLSVASFSYCFVFDKRLLTHPLILKNQVRKELAYTLWSLPIMGSLTSVCFLLEVNGYAKLYPYVSDSKHGWWTIGATVIAFLLFTDFCIYWIHLGLHHPVLYKHIHKEHHRWKVPTPFASHAFHPLDGFSQSLPYHIYVFLLPVHSRTYLILYLFVNLWTVSIHDADYRVPKLLEPFVNGSAHHTDHHLFYNYNYGQYLTLWDRLGGTFKNPSSYKGSGPLDQVLASKENKKSN